MHKLEKVERVVAAVVGLGWSWAALYGTFHDPDPSAQNIGMIVFRIGCCGAILYWMMRRAFGRRMDTTSWALVVLFLFERVLRAKTVMGAVPGMTLVALAFLGHELERRPERAAQPGVEPDGRLRGRGLTP
jgi:hypothetical protein